MCGQFCDHTIRFIRLTNWLSIYKRIKRIRRIEKLISCWKFEDESTT